MQPSCIEPIDHLAYGRTNLSGTSNKYNVQYTLDDELKPIKFVMS